LIFWVGQSEKLAIYFGFIVMPIGMQPKLNQNEYLMGMTFDNITDFWVFLQNTYVKYVHYNINFTQRQFEASHSRKIIL
jgi:hypothetical protein